MCEQSPIMTPYKAFAKMIALPRVDEIVAGPGYTVPPLAACSLPAIYLVRMEVFLPTLSSPASKISLFSFIDSFSRLDYCRVTAWSIAIDSCLMIVSTSSSLNCFIENIGEEILRYLTASSCWSRNSVE